MDEYYINIKQNVERYHDIIEIDLRHEIGAEDFSFAGNEQSIYDFINENSRFNEKVDKYFKSQHHWI